MKMWQKNEIKKSTRIIWQIKKDCGVKHESWEKKCYTLVELLKIVSFHCNIEKKIPHSLVKTRMAPEIFFLYIVKCRTKTL